MPETEAHERGRTRVRHEREPAQRVSPPEQTAIEPAAGPETTLLTLEPGLSGAFSQATFERHAKLLGDPRMSQSMYTRQRTEIVRKIQRDYGNRYVQRLVDHIQQTKARDIQAKLTVGPAGDSYEREADQVARQVMGIISANSHESVQRADEEEDEALRKPLLRRQVEEEEEAIQAEPLLQRQVGAEGGDAGSDVDQAVNRARGHGSPLPDDVRGDMETAFGADFSDVKAHTGSESDALNNSVSARAFTTGQDIFFRDGDYNPKSKSGQELIAHELTHVVQQGGGIQRNILPNSPVVQRNDDDPNAIEMMPMGTTKAILDIEKASEADLQTAAEAYKIESGLMKVKPLEITKEVKGLLAGIEVLLEAGVIVGPNFSIEGEHETRLATIKNKLDGFIGFAAEGKGSIKLNIFDGLEAKIKAGVQLGAELSGSSEQTFDIGGLLEIKTTEEVRLFAGAEAKAEGKIEVSSDGIALSGKAEAFAGIKGEIKTKFDIGSFITLSVKGEASAGVGGKVEGTFKIENGKLTISAEVAATLGIGVGGGVEVEIDFAELAQSIVDAIDEYFKTETPQEDLIEMEDLSGKI